MKQINPPQELVARLRMGGGSVWVVPCIRMPALMLSPAKEWAARDAVLLHLHGGAYMSGGLLQSRALMMPICKAASADLFLSPFPSASLPRAIARRYAGL